MLPQNQSNKDTENLTECLVDIANNYCENENHHYKYGRFLDAIVNKVNAERKAVINKLKDTGKDIGLEYSKIGTK